MISIIILHHNKAEYSQACLQSLLRSSIRPLEVINVDNGSQDNTLEVITAWEDAAKENEIETQLLAFDTNIGAITGRNEAMQAARGNYFVFIDNDTLIFQTDWLDRMHQFLEADTRRGIVAPKLLFPWEPFDIECCGAAVSPRGRVEYLGRGQSRNALTEPRQIQCAISAAWMMPRGLYDEIGGLDEIYSPVQYEDLDYCYRAREASYQVWTLPSVEIFHFEHTTTAGSGDINFKYVTTKNGITFKQRWAKYFVQENATTEEAAQWKVLSKCGIEEIDWRNLIESVAQQ